MDPRKQSRHLAQVRADAEKLTRRRLNEAKEDEGFVPAPASNPDGSLQWDDEPTGQTDESADSNDTEEEGAPRRARRS